MNEHLLQSALALAAIALSVFSLITYLWLGVTTLLMSERRSLVTWVGGLGLLFGALFFLCHGALVAAGTSEAAPAATDLWWRLSWGPAFAAPLLWAAIGLRYTAVAGSWGRLRTPALVVVAGLGACTALLTLLSWPSIGHYSDFIAILDNSLRLKPSDSLHISPWVPLLGVSFVIYVGACASLPWAALAVRRFGPSIEARLAAGGFGLPGAAQRSSAQHARVSRPVSSPAAPETREGEPAEAALLWTPSDAWDRARPALFAASLCMLAAGAVVAVVGLITALVEHRSAASAVSQTLPAVTVAPQPGHAALALVLADLVVQVALACLGLLVGWAVVRQGVLVERRLPQRGYLSHWRGMAALAGALALVVAWMGAVSPDALPDLLLLVALVAVAIALLTWQSYVAHDRLLAQLRPFMASLSLGNAGWLATNPDEVERGVDRLFTSLCRDVLGAAHGRLDISAGRLRHSYSYTAPEDERAGDAALDGLEQHDWSLQMSDGRGAVAVMRLGPRLDGVSYTSSDLEIARACGLRILDAVGEFATAQAVASLARRRGLEAELTAALPRRALHDDVLPRLHLAMLRLEAQRARLRARPIAATVASVAPSADGVRGADQAGATEDVASEIGEVVAELGRAHRDLAALMRAAPMASARRLEHGFTGALRGALDGEFRGAFDELEWETPDAAVAAADALPPVMADLLLSATLEAVRNAGRHARGENLHRRLALRVRLSADARMVTAQVSDNGVGLASPIVSPVASPMAGAPQPGEPGVSTGPAGAERPAPSSVGAAGARTGLLTYSALMALVGGSLSVRSGEEGGAVVTIRAPRASDLGGHLGEAAV